MDCPTCGSRIGLLNLANPLSGLRCSSCGEKCWRVLSPARIIGVFVALWVLIAAIRFGGHLLREPAYVWSVTLVFGVVVFRIVMTAPLARAARSTGRDFYVERVNVLCGLVVLTMLGLEILRTTW